MSKGAAPLRSIVWKRLTHVGKKTDMPGCRGRHKSTGEVKGRKVTGARLCSVEEFGFYYKSNGESQQVWRTGMQ